MRTQAQGVTPASAPVRDAAAPRDTTTRVPELSREVWAELAGPSVIAPGAAVRMIYTVSNLEDGDVRVRLRLELPAGWRVLSSIDGERVLPSGEDVEGELHVVAPRDVSVGQVGTVRLWVTMPGETGALYPAVVLRVARSGGLPPGRQGVTGYVQGFRRGAGSGWDTKPADAGSLLLSGRLANGTVLSLTGNKGERFDQTPGLTPFGSDETRLTLDLRRGPLSLSASNVLYASGDVLTGPFVRAEGLRLARTGRVPFELTVGRPRTFIDQAEGLVARGSIGVQGTRAGMRLGLSTLERPAASWSKAYRVDAATIELNATPIPRHRVVMRAGLLVQESDTFSLRTPGFNTGEVAYTYAGERASLTANGRAMPASLPGLFLAGDFSSMAGSLRLTPRLRAVASANQARIEMLSQAQRFETEAYSSGLMWMRDGYRIEVRGNVRQARSVVETQQEAASVALGVPLGRVAFDLYAESGQQRRDTVMTALRVARGGLRWTGASGWASFNVMHADYGWSSPTMRATLAVSLRRSWFELDGGAWVWRGPSFGGTPGVWMSTALPLAGPYELLAGADYVVGRAGWVRYVDPSTGQPLPPEAIDDPNRGPITLIPVTVSPSPWRFTLGMRRRLTVTVPQWNRPTARSGAPRIAQGLAVPAELRAVLSGLRALGDSAQIAARATTDPILADYARLVERDTREMIRQLTAELAGGDERKEPAVIADAATTLVAELRPSFSAQAFFDDDAQSRRRVLSDLDAALRVPRVPEERKRLLLDISRALRAHEQQAARIARANGFPVVATR